MVIVIELCLYGAIVISVGVLSGILLKAFVLVHDWEYIGDPAAHDSTITKSGGLRYRCRKCGRVKDEWLC